MKTAVITGVAGQDGAYLCQLLLEKGYRIIGGVRDVPNALSLLPPNITTDIELVKFDMFNEQSIQDIILQYRPLEVYNFAAYTSGAGMFNNPVDVGEVNGLAVTRILEAIKSTDPKIRFCQASSREIFGEAMESPQNENTVRNPRSPYGAAKLYADSIVKIYREKYRVFACSAILFNHESPRRGLEFVTRKITYGAAKIKLGLASDLNLGNLDALRDWGFAGDYVEGMWLMLQQQQPHDYVLASGETHSVREFCEYAFGYLGLDYREYVKVDSDAYRPLEATELVGSAEKAKRELGWRPKVSFSDLVAMMVDSDLALLLQKGLN
jgi:GDPmannose 4,6-dehydratase